MPDNCIGNGTCTTSLISTVRASLQRARKLLTDGMQCEETSAQLLQLELLEQLLLDQESRLESINRVLEEFNYSVAHELCAPLRRISGFTRELLQRSADQIDLEGIMCLKLIHESSLRMNALIDALLEISRLSHVNLQLATVPLSVLAEEIIEALRKDEPERSVEFTIHPQLEAHGDPGLLKIALRELLGNAWKFSARSSPAQIEFGAACYPEGSVFFVKDNGVGFDMTECSRLFHPFQRLHEDLDFPGFGIGLTTVKRIVERHNGRAWAEGKRGKGAVFYFSLHRAPSCLLF